MPDQTVPSFKAPPEFPRWVCSHAGKAPNRATRRALATQARLGVKARKRSLTRLLQRKAAQLLAAKAS